MDLRSLGIDPGLDAFACVLRPGKSVASGLRWSFLDVPTFGAGARRRINAPALRDWLRYHEPTAGFLESVHPRKGDGIVSSSRFIGGARAIEATLQCCDVPVRPVAPQTWSNFYEIPSYANSDHKKEHSRVLALQLFPELADVLARKKDHGRAEAALLANYGAYCLAPL